MTLDELDQKATIPILKSLRDIAINRWSSEIGWGVNITNRNSGKHTGFGASHDYFPSAEARDKFIDDQVGKVNI